MRILYVGLDAVEEFQAVHHGHHHVADHEVVAWKNAKLLLDKITQLLDFRRLDVGSEKLYKSHGDMVSLVQQLVQGFNYYSENRNIHTNLRIVQFCSYGLFYVSGEHFPSGAMMRDRGVFRSWLILVKNLIFFSSISYC